MTPRTAAPKAAQLEYRQTINESPASPPSSPPPLTPTWPLASSDPAGGDSDSGSEFIPASSPTPLVHHKVKAMTGKSGTAVGGKGRLAFNASKGISPAKKDKRAESRYDHDEDYESDHEAEKDDIKPSLYLDNNHGQGENDVDRKPNFGNKRKSPAKPSGTPKKAKASTNCPSQVGSSKSGSNGGGKKLGNAWSGDEDWLMFQMIHPKVDEPDWKRVAESVGRDAKSCQNRYAIMSKRLSSGIKGMSTGI